MDGIEVPKGKPNQRTKGMDSRSTGGESGSSCTEADGFRLGDESTEVICSHHFIIEPPNGPVSIGICRLCGIQREHWNSLHDVHHWMTLKPDGSKLNKSLEGGKTKGKSTFNRRKYRNDP